MKRATSVVVLLLLVMILALTGTMLTEQAQAKALPGCTIIGCGGGPDRCLTLTVVVKGVTVEYHCYARLPVLQ